jgi:formylglycine-generating enzyme required for sulfatase activity
MQTRRWLVAATLLAAGRMAVAGGLEIISINPTQGKINFKTFDTATPYHNYRVEASTSLTSAVWMMQATIGGIGASTSVTSPAPSNGSATFYRVVATSNSAVFVDGPYMAIDISGGTGATAYPVTYYRTLVDVPGGANNDVYKTTSILMRRLPKGTYTMGSPAGELGIYSEDETQHQVTLTQDFYMGVFEVTQRQWELVMGDRPSYFNNTDYYQTRPVETVSYYDIRENPNNSAINPHWPQSAQVHANSFMGKLQNKTGLAGFDLPTESQWEYACRAGTTTALNSGYNLTNPWDNDPRMSEVGRYWHNGPAVYGYNADVDTRGGTTLAGMYLPNAWGLYDMHGNVWEWCLDWYATYPGTVTDPLGASSGVWRVIRGGSWCGYAAYCRSTARNNPDTDNRDFSVGFRVCCTTSTQE